VGATVGKPLGICVALSRWIGIESAISGNSLANQLRSSSSEGRTFSGGEAVTINQNKLTILDGLLMALVGGLAFLIRVSFLKFRFFNPDELMQLFIVAQETLGDVFKNMLVSSPQAHPLDYLIDHVYFIFFRDTTGLPVLKAVWGTGAVILLYELGRVVWNRKWGFVASLQLAFSSFHFNVSGYVRQYSLIVFLTVLVSLLFIRSLNDKRFIPWYAFALVLFQLATPYALCFSTIHVLAVGLMKHEYRKKIYIAASFSMAIAFLWFLFKGQAILKGSVYAYSPEFWLNWRTVNLFLSEFGQGQGPASIIFFLLFGAGIALAIRSKKYRYLGILTLGLVCLTFFTVAVSLFFSHANFRPHHAIPVLPIYILVNSIPVVFLLHILGQKWPLRTDVIHVAGAVGLAFVIIIMAIGPVKKLVDFHVHVKNEINATAYFMKEKLSANDVVIFCNPMYAATVLQEIDPKKLLQMDSIQMKDGFAGFAMNPTTYFSNGSLQIPLFTLCEFNKPFATIDQGKFTDVVQTTRKNNGHIYLIDSIINYLPEPNLWNTALGIKPEEMIALAPTVYALKIT
jgi:hypothetical protein